MKARNSVCLLYSYSAFADPWQISFLPVICWGWSPRCSGVLLRHGLLLRLWFSFLSSRRPVSKLMSFFGYEEQFQTSVNQQQKSSFSVGSAQIFIGSLFSLSSHFTTLAYLTENLLGREIPRLLPSLLTSAFHFVVCVF